MPKASIASLTMEAYAQIDQSTHSFSLVHFSPFNQPTLQALNPSTNKPVNQSTNQPINQPQTQPIDQTNKQIKQPIKQCKESTNLTNQPEIFRSTAQSSDQQTIQSTSRRQPAHSYRSSSTHVERPCTSTYCSSMYSTNKNIKAEDVTPPHPVEAHEWQTPRRSVEESLRKDPRAF